MKFQLEFPDGKVSFDSKVRRLVRYVNSACDRMLENPENSTELVAKWAKETIERGVVNLAKSAFANRIE